VAATKPRRFDACARAKIGNAGVHATTDHAGAGQRDDRTAFVRGLEGLNSRAYWKFESIPLQRRVFKLSVPSERELPDTPDTREQPAESDRGSRAIPSRVARILWLLRDPTRRFLYAISALGSREPSSIHCSSNGWAVDALHPVHEAHSASVSVRAREPDLLGVDRRVPIGERGIPRNHKHARDARQVGRHILSDAVREILLLAIVAQISKRQHHDR